MGAFNLSFTQEQRDFLAKRFMQDFPDPYHNPRMDKSESLYVLASQVREGVIVELGTYHGNGAVSLAWGAQAGWQASVYTVDPYTPRIGWAGEPYGPEDRLVFEKNIMAAGTPVSLFQMTAQDLASKWVLKIGLWFWDLGTDGSGGSTLLDDFNAWKSWIVPGGICLVHDTLNGRFGTPDLSKLIDKSGLWKYEGQLSGFLHYWRRNE